MSNQASRPNSHASEATSRKWACVVGILTLVSLGVLASPAIPLGIPGEWIWARQAWLEIDPLALCGSSVLAVFYWFWARSQERRVVQLELASTRDAARREGVLVALQCLLAGMWLWGCLWIPPGFPGIARSPTVLYYKRTEGYFWQAAFEVQNTRQFLSGYRDSIARGNDPDRYLHLGTHPPGLTLAYRGLLFLCESSPPLTRAVISSEPASIREAFDSLRQFATPRGQPLSQVEEATLWAATLLTLVAVAGACWPIFFLTLRMSDRVTAWRAATLWPLVPSLLVFFPKSDLLCPVFATVSCWLWLDGWSRLKWGRCLLAGVGFFFGLMLTLALAPVALLLAVQTSLERFTRRAEFPNRAAAEDVGCVLAAIFGLALPLVALAAWGHCNPFAIWMQNLSNHGLFYDHNTRNYLGWLAVNPLEGVFALGVPVACLVARGVVQSIRGSGGISSTRFSHTVAWLGVWSILWLSGKNMGEAARLWIFLAPWPVMTAAIAMSPKRLISGESSPTVIESALSNCEKLWSLLLAMQLITCLWTSYGVDGFHFAELLSK